MTPEQATYDEQHINPRAEAAIIGSMLQDQTIIADVAKLVQPGDFAIGRNRALCRAIFALAEDGRPVDATTITDMLDQQDTLYEVESLDDIRAMRDEGTSDVAYYCDIITRKATLRRLGDAARKLSNLAYNSNGADVRALIDKAEAIVFGVAQQRQRGELMSMHEVVEELIDVTYKTTIGEMEPGISSGFVDLDDKLAGGFQRGNMNIVAARPSMGKTALGLAIAHNMIAAGKRVAFFSMEMGRLQLLRRLVAMQTGIPMNLIKQGKLTDAQLDKVTRKAKEMGRQYKYRFFADETPALSPLDARTRTRRVVNQYGLDAVFFDYLQLMEEDSGYEGRQNEVAMLSRKTKHLAKELNVAAIALSQLNREVEKRADRRPMLSDLRESGAIEQDADVVMFIYREAKYFDVKPERENIAEIIVAKHRDGPTGTVELHYQPDINRWGDPTYRSDNGSGPH